MSALEEHMRAPEPEGHGVLHAAATIARRSGRLVALHLWEHEGDVGHTHDEAERGLG